MEKRNSKIKYFESIPAVPKREMILSRLGYRKDITVLGSKELSQLEEAIELGASLCKPSGAYMFVPIASLGGCETVLDNGIFFRSQSLSKLLEDSHCVVLMASTVGREVTERIFHDVNEGDASKGLIIDSVASQTADAALDWMMHFLGKMLVREGKKLTKHRYSPGFGDLPLVYQKDIFNALQLERLDIALTEKFMLVPEKSVIAIAGVEEKGS